MLLLKMKKKQNAYYADNPRNHQYKERKRKRPFNEKSVKMGNTIPPTVIWFLTELIYFSLHNLSVT